ncbi:MAG TPA: structural protein [Modicisalibacter sp.]|nr:structural protein [Modicisalibacter sp.]
MKTPRGIRNHNPGNIDRTADKWQGMAADQSSDSRFVVFVAPHWGIRALAKVLLSYQRKHGINTIRGIIDRWAPPVENNTDAYVSQVAKACGVEPDDTIDIENKAVLRALVSSIIKHENGQQPYGAGVIDLGIDLALGK